MVRKDPVNFAAVDEFMLGADGAQHGKAFALVVACVYMYKSVKL
jgi:hypothetical protein